MQIQAPLEAILSSPAVVTFRDILSKGVFSSVRSSDSISIVYWIRSPRLISLSSCVESKSAKVSKGHRMTVYANSICYTDMDIYGPPAVAPW